MRRTLLLPIFFATTFSLSACTAKDNLGTDSAGAGGTPPVFTTLALNQTMPWTIAIDDNNVYWVNANGLGGVYSVSKSGEGTVKTIASGAFTETVTIGLDSTSIYVPTQNGISAFPLSGGGASKVLASAMGTSSVVAANGNLYWLSESSTTSIETLTANMVAASGGTPTLIPLPSTVSESDFAGSAAMLATSDSVYATLSDGVLRIPFDGSAATFIAVPGLEPSAGIAVDDTTIYFGTQGDVASIPLAGGTPKDLVAVSNPVGFVSDGDYLYVADDTPTGRVLKIAKSNAAVTVVADNQGAPHTIAVDATSIYWNCIDEGTIKKIAK